MQEWGDPRKEEFYFYMKSYSPVDNVRIIQLYVFPLHVVDQFSLNCEARLVIIFTI